MILGVACEDDGHFSAVTCLVDAALMAEHAWLDGILDSCRSWRGHGHIDGAPLECEAGMWRKVLMLFCRCEPRPDVVVLVRDMDGYGARRAGMEQVRRGIRWPFAVVIAAPQPEIEAWYVSGFAPMGPNERTALDELRRVLSFDPTHESHRLTSRPNDAVTDAKRVLGALCGGDRDRERLCLADSALLRQRGASNGLGAFLDEVDHRVLPALARRSG